jgi:glycosyltransferase involved in cell wall biosynthesis
MNPRVSIGLPVYNGHLFLPATLESLLAQTFTDFELIVSDNASTDDTESICRDYARRDQRVRYDRNARNLGVAANYGVVFQRSRGEYFKWASANDLCQPTFVERCVAVLDARPDVVLVYPKTRLLLETGAVQDYEDGLALEQASPRLRYIECLKRMRLNNIMNGLIRADALRRTRLVGNYFSSDCNLMAELSLYGRFAEVPEYLFYRRMDKRAATALKDRREAGRHFAPTRAGPMLLQHWRMNLARFGVLWRAPLPLLDRAWLGGQLTRWMVWDRRNLLEDLLAAARYLLTRS